jgi:prepilin-type processing-associated H-X9-DG protein
VPTTSANGLALNQYENNHHCYPIQGMPKYYGNNQWYSPCFYSGFARILPYLDQNTLFQAINFDFACYIDREDVLVIENRTARLTRVAAYLCPADGNADHACNYRWSIGSRPLNRYNGPFFTGRILRPHEVTDGLSCTAFLSERISGSFIPTQNGSLRDMRHPIPHDQPISDQNERIRWCLTAPAESWFPFAGRYWLYNDVRYTEYDHHGSPNDPRPSCDTWSVFNPPRSFHTAGVNVIFGDGHVEFIGNHIDQATWRAIGSFAGSD